MSHPISKRVNFYDGQNIDETDLDLEQSAWHDTASNGTELFAGSGIEQAFTSQRVLFDSYQAPASVQTLISSNTFDGTPIYPIDSFSQTVITQPSDSSQGNQLNIEVSDADLVGISSLKVYIFGTIFGGGYKQEAITFKDNGTKTTRNYYTEIVAIMTQDFRGNGNTLVDGTASRDAGGRLRILEALPLRLARDTIMAEQTQEPNQDYTNFKSGILSKSLDTLLSEISDSASLDKNDLNINITSTGQRKLELNDTGIIVGQKFEATTDNIQKVSILLSVDERSLVPSGEEFDWSGDIVVGIRKLQTTTTCPTDTVPNSAIDFDPEPSPIAEVSFDQSGLEAIGISLNSTPQIVDFIFTQSVLANPSVSPSIIPGDYYMLTIRRSGNISVNNIVLEEAANTTTDPTQVDEMRMSVFSQNVWTDVDSSDLWFQVHTDAVRVVNGTAIDGGVIITSPKIKKNTSTGVEEPYIEGNYSLTDVSSTGINYMIVQQSNLFSEPESHPSTGNKVFSRIEDVPDFSIVSESALTTLIDAGNDVIVLGSVVDSNPTNNPTITGTTGYPGLQVNNKFTIINPSSDLTTNNLVGSVITPNTNKPNIQYRIIKQQTFTEIYGDVNGDGTIDANDVVRADLIGNITSGDGYSTDLETGSFSSTQQQAGVLTGSTVSMLEILRADVDGSGLVDTTDVSLIQQYVSLGTAFSVGSSFTRMVLTLESLTNPLSTTVDIVGTDSAFNTVSFTNLTYQIDFIQLWEEENLILTDLRRFVPQTFTDIESSDITGSIPNGGKNTFFIPDDLILVGNLLDGDGDVKSIDLEVATVTLELPEGTTYGEVDVFNSFVKSTMKFYDGTTVGSSALDDNQVRVSVALQSITKDLDGYDQSFSDGYTSNIDESVSLLYTESSGLLRIQAANIRNIDTRPELSTKIIITVYLKKAGFQNIAQTVSGDDLSDYLTAL